MPKKRLLYVVDHSFPYSSDGYAVRTHAVAQSFMAMGYQVSVLSRLGRLWSRTGFAEPHVAAEQHIHGVRYLFLAEPAQPKGLAYSDWKPLAVSAYREILSVFRPHLVIAASNYENAEPVLAACDGALPFIYEVRGFWELTRASKKANYAQSDAFLAAQAAEAHVAQHATRVLTLNAMMKAELERRGVAGSRIALLPNCLTELPSAGNARDWRRELGITAKVVCGYVGSLNSYEGLPYLLEALAQLRSDGVDAAVVIVGSDAQQGFDQQQQGLDSVQRRLRDHAEQLGVVEHLYFTGRLTPTETTSIYPLLDLVVNPRMSTPVTDLVSSLKSIEAMAHGKPLVLSAIPPHRELHSQGAPVTLFAADDSQNLAQVLRQVIADLPAYEPAQAIAWVRQHRLYQPVLTALFEQALADLPSP